MKSRFSFFHRYIYIYNGHFLYNHTNVRMNKRSLGTHALCRWSGTSLPFPSALVCSPFLSIDRALASLDEDGSGFHCWQFYPRNWYRAGTVCVGRFMHGSLPRLISMWFRWDSTCSIGLKGFWLIIKHNFHSKQYFLESIRNLVTNLYKLCTELLFGYFKQIFYTNVVLKI